MTMLALDKASGHNNRASSRRRNRSYSVALLLHLGLWVRESSSFVANIHPATYPTYSRHGQRDMTSSSLLLSQILQHHRQYHRHVMKDQGKRCHFITTLAAVSRGSEGHEDIGSGGGGVSLTSSQQPSLPLDAIEMLLSNYQQQQQQQTRAGTAVVGFGTFAEDELEAVCEVLRDTGWRSFSHIRYHNHCSPADMNLGSGGGGGDGTFWEALQSNLKELDDALDTTTSTSPLRSCHHLALSPSLASPQVNLQRPRVLLILNEELDEDDMSFLMQQLDYTRRFQQLILIRPQHGDLEAWRAGSVSLEQVWRQLISRHVVNYDLLQPIITAPTDWNAKPIPITPPTSFTPSCSSRLTVALQAELDGAIVTSPRGDRWDVSSMVVLDNFISESLREQLLDLVTEKGWDHSKGPPESKWERALVDVEDCTVPATWGLSPAALQELCQTDCPPPPLIEVYSRLAKLYPEFLIGHMPEAVMGADAAPIVANAPMHGEYFAYHIDTDPALVPPSPWRDAFGQYPNRQPGKPLFVTLLLYLNEEWHGQWDGETLLLDSSTDCGLFVRPKPLRAVLLDQDITHRISPPSQLANRPRYSLAFKLIFYPKGPEAGLERPISLVKQEWGAPTRFGSANRRAGIYINDDDNDSGYEDSEGEEHDKEEEEAAGEEEDLLSSGRVVIRPAGGTKGNGVFVAKRGEGAGGGGGEILKAGSYFGEYKGELLNYEQLTQRYPTDVEVEEAMDYVFEVDPVNQLYVDACNESLSNFARFVNHADDRAGGERGLRGDEGGGRGGCDGDGGGGGGRCYVANVGAKVDSRTRKIDLWVLRDIYPGEECLFDYGDHYWSGKDEYEHDVSRDKHDAEAGVEVEVELGRGLLHGGAGDEREVEAVGEAALQGINLYSQVYESVCANVIEEADKDGNYDEDAAKDGGGGGGVKVGDGDDLGEWVQTDMEELGIGGLDEEQILQQVMANVDMANFQWAVDNDDDHDDDIVVVDDDEEAFG